MTIVRLAIAVALAFGASTTAFADDPPWYQGVSKDKQKTAYDLFKQGNALFEQNEYARAVELYEKALAIWDHPGIRFNLAVSLVNLDRVVEAYPQLEAAMRYGVAGLETQTRFKEAQTYKRLLEGRLVMLTVRAAQDGVEITLDGKHLDRGKTSIVMPGAHALVATKAGFETMTKNVTLVGGVVTENVTLSPRQRRTKLARRYRTWVPWTLVGVGSLIGLAGGGVITIARTHEDKFEGDFANACPDGCSLGDPTKDVDWKLHDRATLEHRIGLAAVAVGGSVLLTGLVMVALNSPREVEVDSGIVVTATKSDVGVAWLRRF